MRDCPAWADDDSTAPDFWSKRYAAGKTPWDLQGVPEALREFLAPSPARASVLIPGCGSGYEVRAFHDAGYDVTALDFSPVAIEQAQHVLGPLSENVKLGDFFTCRFEDRPFDLIYERTFLCSMPPSRWPDYARRMSELLAPGGCLIGVFLYGQVSDPPPFPITEAQMSRLFRTRFEMRRSETLTNSLPVFDGMEEHWQEWRLT